MNYPFLTLKERDIETGLDYFGARYYGSAQGRFTSPDNFLNDTHRSDPASWNLHTYVRNNPLRYIDPTGEVIRVVNIDGANRDELLNQLNDNYGCSNCVTVDKNNNLSVDTTGLSKDVLAAAQFLTDAINDKNYLAFAVGYEGNANINFAKAGRDVLEINGKKYDAILIDFKDFKAVSGDKDCLQNASQTRKNGSYASSVALKSSGEVIDWIWAKHRVRSYINLSRTIYNVPSHGTIACAQISNVKSTAVSNRFKKSSYIV